MITKLFPGLTVAAEFVKPNKHYDIFKDHFTVFAEIFTWKFHVENFKKDLSLKELLEKRPSYLRNLHYRNRASRAFRRGQIL